MSLTKALIKSCDGASVELTVQFNPKELQIDKTVSWTNAQGPVSENPVQEFKEPQSSTLSTTLYFDTYEAKADGKSVKKAFIDKLEKLVTIDEGIGRPPLVIFQWGNFQFKGVVESLSQKYTMFFSDGTPCRCEVGFKMKSSSKAQTPTVAKAPTGPGGGT